MNQNVDCNDFVAYGTLGRPRNVTFESLFVGRPLCRNVSRIFVVSILENFAGDFLGGFSWALFPTKMRRNNSPTELLKTTKKTAAQISKSPRNPFCRKPTPFWLLNNILHFVLLAGPAHHNTSVTDTLKSFYYEARNDYTNNSSDN